MIVLPLGLAWRFSKPSKQHKDQYDNDYKTKPTAAQGNRLKLRVTNERRAESVVIL